MKRLTAILVALSFISACGGMETVSVPDDTVVQTPPTVPSDPALPDTPAPRDVTGLLELPKMDASQLKKVCYRNFSITSNEMETLLGISKNESASQMVRVLKMESEDGAFLKVGNLNVKKLVFVAEEMHDKAVAVFYLDTSTAPIGYRLYGYIGTYGCTDETYNPMDCPMADGVTLGADQFGTSNWDGHYYLHLLSQVSASMLYISQKGEGSTMETTIGQGTTSIPSDLFVNKVPMGDSETNIVTKDGVVLVSPKDNIGADKFSFKVPCSSTP